MVNGKHFLYPSTLIVSNSSNWIITILGPCVAVCLHDTVEKAGGMNHYMLPFWNGRDLASPKYGNIAIKKLVDEMMAMGSNKNNLIAKVFGGGKITQAIDSAYKINERNIAIAKIMLQEYEIPVISSSVGGKKGRKIQFNPESGEVLHKFIMSNSQMQFSVK